MSSAGIIEGFQPKLNLHALGFKVKAFVTLEVKEGQIDSVIEPLKSIPEVLEVHSVAAQGDLLCLVAARTNEMLMDVLEEVLSIPDVARTSTAVVLKTQIAHRHSQLLD